MVVNNSCSLEPDRLTPTTALDVDYPHGPPYAGHDDFLEDEVAVFPPQLNQPCGTRGTSAH